MSELNRCYNCKFWATKDEGYSNYTVTETVVHCLKKHFQPTKESYSWEMDDKNPINDNIFFKQAENCIDFKKQSGVQIRLDVDGDENIEDFKGDLEVYEAAKQYD